MKNILIYARVSTNDGTQDYNRQVDELKLIAENQGYDKDKIMTFAESISGFKKIDERPQLKAMMELIESDPSNYIVFTSEISRIGREPSETRQIVDRLTDIGVPIYIQSLNLWTIVNGNRNGITNIILQVLMEYAQIEADTLKVRSKSGMLKSAKSGKMGGGKSWAYGYAKDNNGMMVIDVEEAEAIKMIFEMYSQGNGYRVISNRLIAEGYKTRFAKSFGNKKIKSGKVAEKIKWSDNAIKGIIQNTIYYGERKYKDEIIRAPAIISKELFDECNNLRENKDFRNYVTSYTYLLRNICKCGVCGRNYFAKFKVAKEGDKVYACSSKLTKEGSCGNLGINISLIESAIYNELTSTDAILKYINNNKEIKTQLESEIRRLEHQLNSNNLNLSKKNNRLQKLLEMRLDNEIGKTEYLKMSGDLNEEIATLSDAIKLINKELNQKKRAIKTVDSTKANKQVIQNAKDNRTELQAIFNQIIHKVIINKIDNKTVMANIFISLNGIVLLNTLKLFLDIGGLKKKPAVYRYYAISKIENEPVYVNGVLILDTNNIRLELENTSKYIHPLLPNYDWVYLKKEDLLTIPILT